MNKNIIDNIRLLHQKGVFYNFTFSGDTQKISDVVHKIYNNKNIFNVHILDNPGDTNLIQLISNFIELKSIRDDNNCPKVVVIHQQNEGLADNLIDFLEKKMNIKTVKFVFISSTQYVISESILNKTINFMIPDSKAERVVLEKYNTSSIELAKTTIRKHDLSKLQNQIPDEIFEHLKTIS